MYSHAVMMYRRWIGDIVGGTGQSIATIYVRDGALSLVPMTTELERAYQVLTRMSKLDGNFDALRNSSGGDRAR